MALTAGSYLDDSFASPMQLHCVDMVARRLALPTLAARDGRETVKQQRHEQWRINVAVGDVAFSPVGLRKSRVREAFLVAQWGCVCLIASLHTLLNLVRRGQPCDLMALTVK